MLKNQATIDSRYVARNSQKVAKYCSKARNETLMSAIQRNGADINAAWRRASVEVDRRYGDRERPLGGPPCKLIGQVRQVP
jgi:hypothetical protein